jgi:hypothetical protein
VARAICLLDGKSFWVVLALQHDDPLVVVVVVVVTATFKDLAAVISCSITAAAAAAAAFSPLGRNVSCLVCCWHADIVVAAVVALQ